jgi:hypothetical protein
VTGVGSPLAGDSHLGILLRKAYGGQVASKLPTICTETAERVDGLALAAIQASELSTTKHAKHTKEHRRKINGADGLPCRSQAKAGLPHSNKIIARHGGHGGPPSKKPVSGGRTDSAFF